jgi:predicted metal-dependent enzyme (double-stranded beta helix superfamily)
MGNQEKNMSVNTDHGDPKIWDPELDAVSVAPDNHVVLHEDDFIRVLSVRLPPGETEKPHHHRFPSILIIDRGIKAQDFDGITHKEIKRSSPDQGEPLLPVVVRLPPQALHYIENQDTKAFHGIRIEFKKGFPTERGSTAGPSYGYPDEPVR